jgi:hypothetical protein
VAVINVLASPNSDELGGMTDYFCSLSSQLVSFPWVGELYLGTDWVGDFVIGGLFVCGSIGFFLLRLLT